MKDSAKKNSSFSLEDHHVHRYRNHGLARVDLASLCEEKTDSVVLDVSALNDHGVPLSAWYKQDKQGQLPVVLLASGIHKSVPDYATPLDGRDLKALELRYDPEKKKFALTPRYIAEV